MRYGKLQSQELQRRANDVIAHGALTNSKRPASFVEGVYPTHLASGRDATVFDADENWYIDYIGGLGAHHFGYRNPEINDAVVKQIEDFGSIFSLGSKLEVEVAEAFRDRFPFLQRLRFLKTASEACSAALRIARSFTKKSCVLSEGYHGWHDDFVSLTPPAEGVPARYWMENLPSNAPIFYDGLAAVIVEPVITDAGPDRIRWLHDLRAETKKRDVLLIFDETITGIRYPGLSVAKATGIDPDIAIMGKAIGGGYPLALVGGRADVMSCDYFVSSTFAGDCVALAAAKKVLELIARADLMDRTCEKANAFCNSFNHIGGDTVWLSGYGTRSAFLASDELTRAIFFQEACKAGVLFGPSFFYGTTHPTHDEFVLDTCRTILNRIKTNQAKLEGSLPAVAYAQKVRKQQ